MDNTYGPLQDIVPIAVSLIAAGTAIGVAWMRRAKWMPPEEAVAGGTLRMAGLASAVLIGILFVMRARIGAETLLAIAGISLMIALLMLGMSIYTNTRYAIYRPSSYGAGGARIRVLGGATLTEEARTIAKRHKLTGQGLYDNANHQAHLVWTPGSLARVEVMSVLGFILLQVSGSVALASVAIAFDTAT